jgi:hypothetical protein
MAWYDQERVTCRRLLRVRRRPRHSVVSFVYMSKLYFQMHLEQFSYTCLQLQVQLQLQGQIQGQVQGQASAIGCSAHFMGLIQRVVEPCVHCLVTWSQNEYTHFLSCLSTGKEVYGPAASYISNAVLSRHPKNSLK